jgi:hypothetical protein
MLIEFHIPKRWLKGPIRNWGAEHFATKKKCELVSAGGITISGEKRIDLYL